MCPARRLRESTPSFPLPSSGHTERGEADYLSDFCLFLLPLWKIFLPSFPTPLALPSLILAAPFPVPTPTSLPAPAAPLPRSAAALPGCKVARLPAAPAVPLPRLPAPLAAPLPTSSPPLPTSLPGLVPAFCFLSFCAVWVWVVL